MINTSIITSIFPQPYKVALVTPIFKKGNRTLPANYRPISSLPILSKVFERIMYTQIIDHINIHEMLSSKQFGFRHGVSTEQMLLCLLDQFYHTLDTKKFKYIAILSLDVKKAFDTVNHTLLLKKLKSIYLFAQSSTALMTSYLSNRSQCMAIRNATSSVAPITKGVPQGSILGPLLFNLMVNDMLDQHDQTYSYADDTLTFSYANSQKQALNLVKNNFISLNKWYENNGLSLCINKTNCLIISNCHIDYEHQLCINEYNLDIKHSLTLLGITLDSKLDFKTHIQQVSNKCNSLLFVLRKIRHLLSYEDTKLIYTSIIRPRLEYCSSIFLELPYIQLKLIESLQNKAIRIICKAPKIFSITDSRIILNLHTICSRRSFFFSNLVIKTLCGLTSSELFKLLENRPKHTRQLRSNCNYVLPPSSSNLGKRRFTSCAIKSLTSNDFNLSFEIIP